MLFLGKALGFLTRYGAKSITGPVKDVAGTVKDMTGIRKDIVETQLAESKLAEQKKIILTPTFEERSNYDPKLALLMSRARKEASDEFNARLDRYLSIILVSIIVGSAPWAHDRIGVQAVPLPFAAAVTICVCTSLGKHWLRLLWIRVSVVENLGERLLRKFVPQQLGA